MRGNAGSGSLDCFESMYCDSSARERNRSLSTVQAEIAALERSDRRIENGSFVSTLTNVTRCCSSRWCLFMDSATGVMFPSLKIVDLLEAFRNPGLVRRSMRW